MTRTLVVAVVVLVGCTKPNPNRCCTDEADCMAKNIPVGSICDEGLLCRGNQCIAETCSSSAACDQAAPYCAEGFCSEACTDDTQCPGFGQAGVSYCVEGACVACRDSSACPSSTPFCEGGGCRQCKAHSECASDLCDLDSGMCIDESSILYVTLGGSMSSSCTKDAPCVYSRAFAIVDASRPIMRLYAGAHDGGSSSFDRSVNVAMYGEPSTSLSFLHLYGHVAFKLRDIDLIGGVICEQPTVALPRSSLDIARSSISGIYGYRCDQKLEDVAVHQTSDTSAIALTGETADGSDLDLNRSTITGGSEGIAVNEGSRFHVTNCIFRDQVYNGAFASYTSTTLTSDVSFSTFYNTKWQCLNGPSWITGRNNIILNEAGGAPADTVTGSRCSHSYTLIRPQSTTPAGSNNILGMDPRFVNGAAGDFHLVVGSPAIDAADPAATEATDYDGTARPQGAARDIGAFEYKP